MASFDEERQRFTFDDQLWIVVKYDQCADYLKKIAKLPETKGVDFIGRLRQADGILYWIEAKDFRGYRIQNKRRLSDGELAIEVAQKLRDSIAGVVGGIPHVCGLAGLETVHRSHVAKKVPAPRRVVVGAGPHAKPACQAPECRAGLGNGIEKAASLVDDKGIRRQQGFRPVPAGTRRRRSARGGASYMTSPRQECGACRAFRQDGEDCIMTDPVIGMPGGSDVLLGSRIPLQMDVKPSAEQILRGLGAGPNDREELRQMVIDAEVVRFTEQELPAPLPVLREFIEHFRTSDDPADMVAVGSALRKYVMNMPEADLDRFHLLFDPSAVAPVPFEIELELVKTLVWKLTLAPPDADGSFPELSERLADRAEGYLRPWILLRENHAAVAQDACLGLLLLRSPHVSRLLERLRDLRVDWFVDLLLRRARWLKDDITSRFSPKDAARYARSIVALEESIAQKPV